MDIETFTNDLLAHFISMLGVDYAVEVGAGTSNYLFTNTDAFVTVYEPIPTDELLNTLDQHEKRVELIKAVVATSEGDALFHHGRTPDYGSLNQDWWGVTEEAGMTFVRSKNVCDVLEDVKVAKFDVEGYEPALLQHLLDSKHLMWPKVLSVEIGGHYEYQTGKGGWKYWDNLHKHLVRLHYVGYTWAVCVTRNKNQESYPCVFNTKEPVEHWLEPSAVFGNLILVQHDVIQPTKLLNVCEHLAHTAALASSAAPIDMQNNSVSVAIPSVRSRKDGLLALIKRLRHDYPSIIEDVCIAADYDQPEDIIVDQWVKQTPRLGAIRALQTAANLCKGRYVLIINDDDTLDPPALENARNLLIKNSKAAGLAFQHTRKSKQPRTEKVRQWIMPQIALIRRDIGNLFQWWSLPGARTYGGDFNLGMKIAAHGLELIEDPSAVAVDNSRYHQDEVRKQNLKHAAQDNMHWRDTWINTPLLTEDRTIPMTTDIIYAPIRARQDALARNQYKYQYGLRKALEQYGTVHEFRHRARSDGLWVDEFIRKAEEVRPLWAFVQDHSTSFSEPELDYLKSLGIALVCFAGDHAYELSTPVMARYYANFDVVLFSSSYAVEELRSRGVNAYRWHLGYEPEVLGTDTSSTYDVVYAGNYYKHASNRINAVHMLYHHPGIRFSLWGQWPNKLRTQGTTHNNFYLQGQEYRKAKLICVDLASHRLEARYDAFSNRTWNAFASNGGFVLHEWAPKVEEALGEIGLTAGKHYDFWADEHELKAKVDHYLSKRYSVLRSKAAAAARIVQEELSWDTQVRKVIDYLDHRFK